MTGRRARPALLLALAAAALAIRLALLWSYPGNFDSKSFGLAAEAAGRGEDLYDGHLPYNYGPLWAQVLRGLAALGALWNLDLIRMIGLTLTAADLVSAFLIYRLCRRRLPPERAALAGLLFFANPASVLISSQHGQFDNVSILFLLVALLLVGRDRTAGTATAGSLALSLCVKHVTWFHPLLFAARRRPRISAALAAVPYLVFLGSFLPYRQSWRSIRGAVFGYRAHTTIYGVDWLFGLFQGVPRVLPTIVFVAAMAAAIPLLADVEITRASLVLMLVQLVFLPGFGRQYCVWPIALGALFPSAGYLLYTLVAAGFLLYWLPDWNGTWFAAIFWLGAEVRALAGRRAGRSADTSEALLAGA